VKEELDRIRTPRTSNFTALLAKVPEAGAERIQKATEMARANNVKKALQKNPKLSPAQVKQMFNGSEVTMEDAYSYGSCVGVKADRSVASDPKVAFDALKSFSNAVGGKVSVSFEDFVAERKLFDPFFAFSEACKSSSSSSSSSPSPSHSGVTYEEWYDTYTAQAQQAARDLANADASFKLYQKNGGSLSLEQWRQDCAKRALPLLGHSKYTLSAFSIFLRRDNISPFYQEFKKLLKL